MATCSVIVPADSRYKAFLFKQLHAQHASERASAAHGLAYYPGPETVEALKPLLKDPGTDTMRTGDKRITIYPVRHAAYNTLKGFGIQIPEPEGFYVNYQHFLSNPLMYSFRRPVP